MSKSDDELYEKGLVITDNRAHIPILDFESYKDAIVKIIKGSHPNFTIGIYGDWGTGKTTLMGSIYEKLKQDKENTVTVWFDAWKYENEKEFALIPLLKKINFSIDKEDTDKQELKDALKKAALFTLGISREIISSTVTHYIGENLGGLFKKGLDDITTKITPKLMGLSEFDKNSIFYEGIEMIQKEIDKLRDRKSRDFRFVIFVDDLDRCSEEKILEVLESVKIFLPLKGFIYVLGLSHDRVAELITRKYGIDGEQYLKKFIQIPITLPEWDKSDIEKLIQHFLDENIIHQDYKSIVTGSLQEIAKTIEENPRETKRFLNNLIISYEVLAKIQKLTDKDNKELFLKQMLLVQILRSRWRELYKQIIDSKGALLHRLEPMIPFDKKMLESGTQIDSDLKEILEKYKSNKKLWEFFSKDNFDVLKEVPNWDVFRRALKPTEEPSTGSVEQSNKEALSLLRSGRIQEFNDKRNKLFPDLNLQGAYFDESFLNGANLVGANLNDAVLFGAYLQGAYLIQATLTQATLEGAYVNDANLEGANLVGANLDYANFDGANLVGANLREASLISTHLPKANLTNTNLMNSKLIWVDFEQSILCGADLTNSIIFNPQNYESITLDKRTNFTGALIDDTKFLDYINKFTKQVPAEMNTIQQLGDALLRRGFDREEINKLLGSSKLAEE